MTGEGLDVLRQAVETRIARGRSLIRLALPPQDGASLHWLYENAEILERSADDEGVLHLTLRVAPERQDQVMRRFNAVLMPSEQRPALEIAEV